MGAMIELKKSVPVVADVDVLVVGAGISGATAAVAAGRNGAKTMVVDRFGCPGGNMGPGMVGGAPNMEIPEAMGDCLPGIPGEFIKRCEEYCGGPLLANYFRDSQVVSYVWTQMMQEVGVEFMYNTYAGDPIMDGNRVIGLFVENKNGTQAIRAKVVVDATGDADVVARSGAPTDGGKSTFAPGMYWAMANVDVERYWSEIYPTWKRPTLEEARLVGPRYIDGSNEFSFTPDPDDVRWAESIDESIDEPHTSVAGSARKWSTGVLFPYYRAAWESGEYKFIQKIEGLGYVRAGHGIFRSATGIQYVPDPLRLGKYGIIGALVGAYHDGNPTSGDTKVMTAIEVKARTFIFETAQFLTRHVPGFEKAYLHMISPYFNSRGGRSAITDHPVSVEDASQGRKFDDAVFLVQSGKPYDFPYRQFIPQGVDGLLVTGRACIVQPPGMRVRWMVLLMGQAAGAAAALIAKSGSTTRELDVKELQKVLYHKYQAPFGDEERLKELGII